MGFVIDTGVEGLGLERRKESYYVYEADKTSKEVNVFLYPDSDNNRTGTVELSNPFLKKLIDYFNNHPEEYEKLEKVTE